MRILFVIALTVGVGLLVWFLRWPGDPMQQTRACNDRAHLVVITEQQVREAEADYDRLGAIEPPRNSAALALGARIEEVEQDLARTNEQVAQADGAPEEDARRLMFRQTNLEASLHRLEAELEAATPTALEQRRHEDWSAELLALAALLEEARATRDMAQTDLNAQQSCQ